MLRFMKSQKKVIPNKVKEDKIKKFSANMVKMSSLVSEGKAPVFILDKNKQKTA